MPRQKEPVIMRAKLIMDFSPSLPLPALFHQSNDGTEGSEVFSSCRRTQIFAPTQLCRQRGISCLDRQRGSVDVPQLIRGLVTQRLAAYEYKSAHGH